MVFFDTLITMSPSDLLFQVILPFIFLFAILFGVLQEIRWFDKRVNMLIAISSSLMAFGTTTSFAGAPFLVIYIIPYFAYFAFGVFVVIFAFGALRYTQSRGRDIYEQMATPSEKVKRLINEKEKILKKLADAVKSGDSVKINSLQEQLKDKEKEIELKKALNRY